MSCMLGTAVTCQVPVHAHLYYARLPRSGNLQRGGHLADEAELASFDQARLGRVGVADDLGELSAR